jgi:hypothetical protein
VSNEELHSEIFLSEMIEDTEEGILVLCDNDKIRVSIGFSFIHQMVALRSASNLLARGLYICRISSVEPTFPTFIKFKDSSSPNFQKDTLQKIDLKYVHDFSTLKRVISGLYLWLNPPSVIVIDSLSLILETREALELVTQVMGLLQDILRYFRKERGINIKLLILDNVNQSQHIRTLSICVSSYWVIRPMCDNSYNSFVLRRSEDPLHDLDRGTQVAAYSLAGDGTAYVSTSCT